MPARVPEVRACSGGIFSTGAGLAMLYRHALSHVSGCNVLVTVGQKFGAKLGIRGMQPASRRAIKDACLLLWGGLKDILEICCWCHVLATGKQVTYVPSGNPRG